MNEKPDKIYWRQVNVSQNFSDANRHISNMTDDNINN